MTQSQLSLVTVSCANLVEPTAAAAGPRTATSLSQQPHRSHVIMHIYALTKAAIEAVIKDVEKAISEYLADKVLDQPLDQLHIAKLTDHQVMFCL